MWFVALSNLIAVALAVVVAVGLNYWAGRGFPWNARVLPTLLIAIDVAAAVGYGVDGGFAAWRNIVYWLAAATLTCVVTY